MKIKANKIKEPRNKFAVLYVRGLGVWVTYVIIVTVFTKNKHKIKKDFLNIEKSYF